MIALLLACSPARPPVVDAPPPADPCSAPLVVEPGLGADAFTPLASGDTLPLIQGVAGGWHAEYAVRVHHLQPYDEEHPDGAVAVHADLWVDGVVVADGGQPTYSGVEPVEPCVGEVLDLRAWSQASLEEVCALIGAEATLELEVADASDETRVDTLERSVILDVLEYDGSPQACP